MFHRNPDWLVACRRTVELTNAIEISDPAIFVETAPIQPEAVLDVLAHAYQARLADNDQAALRAAYRQAMERGLYRSITRPDGSTGPAYATANEAEYSAELSEAYFGRNDFFPFTRADLTALDPAGYALVGRLWYAPTR